MSGAKPRTEADRPAGPRYQPLVIVLAALAAGMVADRALAVPVGVWALLFAAGFACWLALWHRRWDVAAGLVLLLPTAAAGGAWHHLQWSIFADNEIGLFARADSQPVCVEAVACDGPRRTPAPPFDPMRGPPSGDRCRLEVEVTAIRDRAALLPASGRATLWVDGRLLGVHAGDRLRVFADLALSRPAANPGEFDFAQHARGDRILSTLAAQFPDSVSVIEPGGRLSVSRLVERLRSEGDRLLWRHLDEERSGLAAALLLGLREEISPDRTEAFVETGTVHLLAISGLHVGMLVLALSWAMRLAMVSQRRAALVLAGATVLYLLVTGVQPPVVRATVLVLVASAGTLMGRRGLGFNSLAAAGVIVLALNPADLFRAGAQLSFLAVTGMAWFLPGWVGDHAAQDPLDRLIERSMGWPERAVRALGRATWRLFLTGLVVWLLSLPLVMARFHLFSPVALGLNMVVWLPMLTAMVAGFGVLLVGWVVPPLGTVLGIACDRSLAVSEWLIEAGARAPWGHVWVPGPEEWWLWGFYGGLAVLAAFPALRPPRRWCLALLAVWAAVGFGASGLASSAMRTGPRRMECAFLGVEHGCAVVLHLPDGRTVLYDAGRMAAPVPAARSIAGYLWSRGITHLDAVVLSHPDADHYNAMPELVERVSIGVVYVSPVMFENEADSPGLAALRKAIDGAGVPIREVQASDRLGAGDDCRIEVLHPPRRGVLGGDNPNSIVLAVESRGRRVLLTGDLETPGLEDVLAEPPWDCDVLLVPHHGSRKSSPAGLAEWCKPEWVVFSAGRQFDSRSTEQFYAAAGAHVLHTGRQGAICASLDEDGVAVQCHLEPGEKR